MIFTHSNRVTAKFVALLAVFSMILSAFPASFFIAEAATPTTIFTDSFETTPAFSSPSWDNDPQWSTNSSDSRTGTKQAQVVGTPTGTTTLKVEIDTSDYESLSLSFWYKKLGMDDEDSVVVEWFDGTDWYLLTTISGVDTDSDDSTDWEAFVSPLPGGAENNADFALRFVSDMNSAGGDKLFLEDVNLTGDEIIPETGETVFITGDTTTSGAQPEVGWMFNRDTANQTPFEFNFDEMSIGDGALFIEPITNTVQGDSDKFIAELFFYENIEDVELISYDFQLAVGSESEENHFYASVYLTLPTPNAWYDCRYSVVPTTGSTANFTTITFDPEDDYPVDSKTGSYSCPDSPSDMPDGSSLNFFAINVGDTSANDAGVSGYLDNVVTVVDQGASVHTTTYDFEPKAPEVTIVTNKVICESEADLPNYQDNGGANIDADTAADWVAQHAGCWLEPDWDFQWYPDNILHDGVADDTLTGEKGGLWTTFSGTTTIDITDIDGLSFREVLEEGYIPFTYLTEGSKNTNNITAEFHCSTGGKNYDNLEWAKDIEDGDVIQCVAFNVPEPAEMCSVTVISDETNTVIEKSDAFAEVLSFVHSGWTAVIADATWIWGDDPVSDPTTNETQTFVKEFEWDGNIASALLDIATDNWYEVTLNGVVVATSIDDNNFQLATQDQIDVSVEVIEGVNILEIAVTNKGTANSNPTGNPAGLLYNLTIVSDEEGNSCQSVPEEPIVASLEITNPATDGETLEGEHTFEAEYIDDDETVDTILWAIRAGTCAASTGTVAGNVDGFTDTSSFSSTTFSTTVDMSTWDDGEYCFVVNPQEGGGTDFRETRTFFLDNPEPIACVPGVNILENPSFEDPKIESSWALVDPVVWLSEKLSGGAETVMEIQRGVFGWTSSDGEQHAELATSEATRLSQTVETIPGKEYTLSWDYSARPNTDKPESKMVVRVNGSKVATNNKNGQADVNWKSKDYTFIANSTETTVSFEDRDKGDVAGKGPLLDNISLTCDTPDEPEPEVGPYCGDGEINQPWEQCDLGYMGSEAGYDESGMCNATCQYDNQCVEVNLVRITLEDTESVSFDDTVYLGSALNELPNGVWFNFDEVGDDAAHTIANNSDGLGVERDTDTSELKLAFVGGNSMKKLDQALGSIELFGFEAGSINRQLNPQFKLEDGSGNSFDDYFFKSSPTVVDFDLRADTGNDGVILGLEDVDICEPDIIDGHKWNDENGNGYWDEGEEAMEGWTIYLESLNESEEYEDASTVTDENGYYYFMVDGGNWEVTEEEQDGWVQTAPYGSCEFYLEEQVQEAKLLSIESEDWEHEYENENHCDFGNHYYFETITGFKWNDENDNGIWDTNESKLSGWTIELVDEEDSVASTTVTDADGYYSFNEVPEGVWTVREVEQEGWRQTAPASGSCEFEFVNPAIQKDFLFFDEVESDEDSKYTCDFGNYEGGEIRTGGSGSGGLSSSSASTPEEQVLGASTSQCGMYLYDYMKQGQENKVFEVQKLQLFLLSQKYYDVGLSGVFDSATDAGVKAFQAAHSADVLKPWVDLGIAADETPTGYVYKTTRWKINDMVCPGSESFPTLP